MQAPANKGKDGSTDTMHNSDASSRPPEHAKSQPHVRDAKDISHVQSGAVAGSLAHGSSALSLSTSDGHDDSTDDDGDDEEEEPRSSGENASSDEFHDESDDGESGEHSSYDASEFESDG